MNDPRGVAHRRALLTSGVIAAVMVVASVLFLHWSRSHAVKVLGVVRVVIERQLQNGLLCRVALAGLPSASNRVGRLTEFSVHIGTNQIDVPHESFNDLDEMNLHSDVDIADFAADTYILTSGDPNKSPWHAKLTFRNGRLAERALWRGSGDPVVTRYLPPLRIGQGRITKAEMDAYRKEMSSIAPTGGIQ